MINILEMHSYSEIMLPRFPLRNSLALTLDEHHQHNQMTKILRPGPDVSLHLCSRSQDYVSPTITCNYNYNKTRFCPESAISLTVILVHHTFPPWCETSQRVGPNNPFLFRVDYLEYFVVVKKPD